MTKERLNQLNISQLQDFAEKHKIRFSDSFSKAELIDNIIEELEEIKQEREQENVPSVKIEELKYHIALDEEIEAQDKGVYPIPESYQGTEIIFITRDPFWAFAYWTFDSDEFEALKNEPGFEALVLRVHDVKWIDFNGKNSNFNFDIPIQFNDDNWYINLPHPDSNYLCEIVIKSNGSERVICSSNVIYSPKADVSDESDEKWISAGTDKIIDIVRREFKSFTPDMESFPQRIISFISSSYIPYQK
ncbi:MAG: DUF4912 domain-containing protein [Spirochaetales bacterium]|nr:DUF4912 domain-containing protein [Spirochaetales bacterium]